MKVGRALRRAGNASPSLRNASYLGWGPAWALMSREEPARERLPSTMISP